MPAKFNKKLWVRKGGFVVLEESELAAAGDSKITGTILQVCFATLACVCSGPQQQLLMCMGMRAMHAHAHCAWFLTMCHAHSRQGS